MNIMLNCLAFIGHLYVVGKFPGYLGILTSLSTISFWNIMEYFKNLQWKELLHFKNFIEYNEECQG